MAMFFDGQKQKIRSFREIVKLLTPASKYYLAGPNLLLHADQNVRDCLRQFRDDSRLSCRVVEEACLWAGCDNQRTRMHFDISHNLLHVLQGSKGAGRPKITKVFVCLIVFLRKQMSFSLLQQISTICRLLGLRLICLAACIASHSVMSATMTLRVKSSVFRD
jgi:hypothetical protein